MKHWLTNSSLDMLGALKKLAAETPPAPPTLAGMPIYTSPHVPKHPERWVFPEERFVEYEESDEDWCRYFGFGHSEEDTSKTVVFAVDFGAWPNPTSFATLICDAP